MKRAILIAALSTSIASVGWGQNTRVGAVGVNGSTTLNQHAPQPPSDAIPGVVVNAAPAPAPMAGAGQAVARPALAFPATNTTAQSNITPAQMQNINRLDQELAALASLGAGGVVQQRQLLDTL